MKTKIIDGRECVYAPCNYTDFCPADTIDCMVSSLHLDEWNGVRVFSFEHRVFLVDTDRSIYNVHGRPVDDIAMMMFRTSMHTFLDNDPEYGMDDFIEDADDYTCEPLFIINGIVYLASWSSDDNVVRMECLWRPRGVNVLESQRSLVGYFQEGDERVKESGYGIVGTYSMEDNGDVVCEFWHWDND